MGIKAGVVKIKALLRWKPKVIILAGKSIFTIDFLLHRANQLLSTFCGEETKPEKYQQVKLFHQKGRSFYFLPLSTLSFNTS